MKPTTVNPVGPTTAALAPAPTSSALRVRWQTLAPRERQLVTAAVLLVAAALAWWLLLAPAVRTLREAPAQHAKLDAQLESMQMLAQEAQQLKADATNRPSQTQAQRALLAATTALGAGARATFVGDRATVTLQGVPASAIGPWLAQVRGNARSVPVEAHLTRNTTAVPAQPLVRPAFARAPVPTPASAPNPALAAIAALSVTPVSQLPVSPGIGPAPDNAGMPMPPSGAPEARWDGRIVLALPAR